LIWHTRKEIEADFRGGVALDAALEDGDDGVGEGGGGAGAVGYGGWLEAVEFVEGVVYGGVSVVQTSSLAFAVVDVGGDGERRGAYTQ
jgi:hypothetical protein